MDENLYPMIFKRKSFHLFKNIGSISQRELSQIEESFRRCQPLIPEIPLEMKIVPAADTTCKRGRNTASCSTVRSRRGIFPTSDILGSSWI